jgi:cyclic pyranopterin phosphate synthase
MIDVSPKADTERRAVAQGLVRMKPATRDIIRRGKIKKGDILGVAQTAGIMAAKETSRIIPLCHPLLLNHVQVDFELPDNADFIEVTATVTGTGKTGVEMEALTAVAISALTIYDMCKAADKGITIGGIHLLEKSGGKSGHYIAESDS